MAGKPTPYDLLTVFSCYPYLYSISNCQTWFSHLKKKKEGGQIGLQESCVKPPLGLGKERDWSWKLFVNENCFGRSVNVITYTWGQQTVCPWKPPLSTSAIPTAQHRACTNLLGSLLTATTKQIIWSWLFLYQKCVQRA